MFETHNPNEDFSALSGDWLQEENTDDEFQDGYYCPIYLEPMVGSGERVCIAVVGATSESFLIARTPGLERLRCFYDDSADFLLRVAEEVCVDLEIRIGKRGWRDVGQGIALSQFWKSPFEGFLTGESNWATGRNAEEIAEIGLQMCASLVRNGAVEAQKTLNLTRTRLLEQVKEIVLDQKRDWKGWFDTSLPTLSSHKFDFLGQRLAAHIGILPPSDLMPNVYTSKSGVFDLSFLKSQPQEQLWTPLDERNLERYCLLLHLDKNQVAKNGRQTKAQETADQLTLASEKFGIQVYPCYSPQEVARQLIQLEAA